MSQCSIGFCCQRLCLVEYSQWMQHLPVKPEPLLDSAQDTRLQRTVVMLDTTSLQT